MMTLVLLPPLFLIAWYLMRISSALLDIARAMLSVATVVRNRIR